MSGIFGHLNLSDTDRVFNATQGQKVIYDAAMEYINKVSAEMAAAYAVFIDETTSDHKRRYKLPGGGYLQRWGSDGRFGAVKAYGSWDVAFPLEDLGAQIASNDVDRAYMTVAELDRHISTIVAQDVQTVRKAILDALFNSAQDTFVDPLWGSLSVEPLANGDAVTYPPVLGAASEATDTHSLESGYAASAITDTNNPFETIRAELEEHFGVQSGGSNIAVFINNAQKAKAEALTDYDTVIDRFMIAGADTDRPGSLPNGLPGICIGRTNGVWVYEWRYIPANYMLGIHLDAQKPLIQRVDPADTGLGEGLQLIAEDSESPFESSMWRHRFGFGCGNRLNGVAFELGVGGTYTVPTIS